MLGEIIIARRILGNEQLERMLAICRNTRTRLGEVLVGEGLISYRMLYSLLAIRHGLDFVNLLKIPPDITLLDAAKANEYLRMRALPFKREQGRLLIATSEYTDDTIRWAHANYGADVTFVITSPVDIHRTIQQVFAAALTHQSVMGLYEVSPQSSARRHGVRSWWPLLVIGNIMLACALLYGVRLEFLVIFALCHILYAATLLFKVVIYLAGMKQSYAAVSPPWLPDAELPVYTILIPMYKETESLPGMLQAMQRMDYPASKLDIKLVFEADDLDTLLAAQALKPRYHFEIVHVPPSQPRTKPKACNYALRFARGDYVTVYDADDRPDPRQLRKAVQAFAQAPSDVICLQARLNYYNTHDNWLTRMFSLEYAMLFHVLLHGMSRLSMPVMLGGTSNHIAMTRLRELGEWDPFNVTEDADLGTRMAALGFRTMMLDSDTMEEAPNTLHAWMQQRTRWIKGYMQTWLVHMRHPIRLLHGLGSSGFIGFQCFVALSSFSYLTAPLSWLVVLGWLVEGTQAFPHWLYQLALINLSANILIHIGTAVDIGMLYRQKRGKMLVSAIFYPIYLILHSFASYVALWQLIVKPYVWNKTTHGKAKTFTDFQLTKPHPAR